MTAKEIIRMFKADGWTEKNQRGSHLQFVHPSKAGKITVPIHSRDLDTKTCNSIVNYSAIELPSF